MISVVMATYNGEQFVKEQLDSILNQTYQDFEIIIVDDNSSDNTIKIAKSVFEKSNFNDFRILQNETNLGVNRSFEKGIREARGEYIAFSDQDDIWKTNKLECLFCSMDKENIELVYSQSIIFNTTRKKQKKLYPSQNYSNDMFIRLQKNNARGASMLVKKDFLEKIIPFSENILYDFQIYCFAVCFNNLRKVAEPMDYYRIHNQNVVGTKLGFNSKIIVMSNLERRFNFYKEFYHKILTIPINNIKLEKDISLILVFYKKIISSLKNKTSFKDKISIIIFLLKKEFSIKERFIYTYYLFFLK